MPRGPEHAGEPHLSVAAVARMLGIAPATLRTWDRRYGIGPSAHAPGRHRRYSPDDIARLETMRHALVRGVGPAEAARYALATANGRPTTVVHGARPRAGGTMLRLPGAGRYARGLGRAALALDFPAARTVLVEAVDALGVVATWDDVARPVLAAVAPAVGDDRRRAWRSSTCSARASPRCSARARRRAVRRAPTAGRSCSPGMPRRAAHAAAAGARGRARRPGRPRAAAGRRPALRWPSSRPCAAPHPPRWCCGRSSRRAPTSPCWTRCRETRPRSRTFVAGPGWAEVDAARAGAARSTSLVEAVDALVTARAVTPVGEPGAREAAFGSTPDRIPRAAVATRGAVAGRRRPGRAGPLRRRGAELERLAADPASRSGRRPRRRHPRGAPAPTRRARGGPPLGRAGLRLAAAALIAVQPRGVTRRPWERVTPSPSRTTGPTPRRRGSTRWSGWPPTRSGWATRPRRSGCSPPRRPRSRPTRPGDPRPGRVGAGRAGPRRRAARGRAVAPAEAALAAAGRGGSRAARAQVPDRARCRAGGRRGDDPRGRRHRVGRRGRRVRRGWGCSRCAGLRASPRST